MKIKSEDIPQADVLDDVIRTVEIVKSGGSSYQQIASVLGKVDRQGRYYRKAAEILGFIETPNRNKSVVTDLGNQLLIKGIGSKILFNAVIDAPIFQRLIPFMELNNENGVSGEQIIEFLISIADLNTGTMGGRRFYSVVAWAEKIGLISKVEGLSLIHI